MLELIVDNIACFFVDSPGNESMAAINSLKSFAVQNFVPLFVELFLVAITFLFLLFMIYVIF